MLQLEEELRAEFIKTKAAAEAANSADTKSEANWTCLTLSKGHKII